MQVCKYIYINIYICAFVLCFVYALFAATCATCSEECATSTDATNAFECRHSLLALASTHLLRYTFLCINMHTPTHIYNPAPNYKQDNHRTVK